MDNLKKSIGKNIFRLVLLILIILFNFSISIAQNNYRTNHLYGQIVVDLGNPSDQSEIQDIRYLSNKIGYCVEGLKINVLMASSNHDIVTIYPGYKNFYDEGDNEILIVLLTPYDFHVVGGDNDLRKEVLDALKANKISDKYCMAYAAMKAIRIFYNSTDCTVFNFPNKCNSSSSDNIPPPPTNNNIGINIPDCVETLKNEIKSLTGLNVLVDLKYSILIDEDVDIDNNEAIKLKVKNDFGIDEFIYVAIVAPKKDNVGWTSKFVLSDGYQSVLTDSQINQLTMELNNSLAATPTNDMGNVICDALLSLKQKITEPDDLTIPSPYDGTPNTEEPLECGPITKVNTSIDINGNITISFPITTNVSYIVSYKKTGVTNFMTLPVGTEIDGKYIVVINGTSRNSSYNYKIEADCGTDIFVHTGITGNFQGYDHTVCPSQTVQIGKTDNSGVGYTYYWSREDGNNINVAPSTLTKPRFSFVPNSRGIFKVTRTHSNNINTDEAVVKITVKNDCSFNLRVSDKTLNLSKSTSRMVETNSTSNVPTLHLVKDLTTGDGGILKVLSDENFASGYPAWKERNTSMGEDENITVDYQITPKDTGLYEISATTQGETKKLKIKIHDKDETINVINGYDIGKNIKCPPGSETIYGGSKGINIAQNICQVMEDFLEPMVKALGSLSDISIVPGCSVQQTIKCFRAEIRNSPNVTWNQTRDISVNISMSIDADIPVPYTAKTLRAAGTVTGNWELNFLHNQNMHVLEKEPTLTMSQGNLSNFILTGEICIVAGPNQLNVQGCFQIPLKAGFRLNHDTNCYEMNFGINPIVLLTRVSLIDGVIENEYSHDITTGYTSPWVKIYCY